MDPHLAAPLFSQWLTPLKDFMHDKWGWKPERGRHQKVFGGAVMVRTEREKNEESGGGGGVRSGGGELNHL